MWGSRWIMFLDNVCRFVCILLGLDCRYLLPLSHFMEERWRSCHRLWATWRGRLRRRYQQTSLSTRFQQRDIPIPVTTVTRRYLRTNSMSDQMKPERRAAVWITVYCVAARSLFCFTSISAAERSIPIYSNTSLARDSNGSVTIRADYFHR